MLLILSRAGWYKRRINSCSVLCRYHPLGMLNHERCLLAAVQSHVAHVQFLKGTIAARVAGAAAARRPLLCPRAAADEGRRAGWCHCRRRRTLCRVALLWGLVASNSKACQRVAICQPVVELAVPYRPLAALSQFPHLPAPVTMTKEAHELQPWASSCSNDALPPASPALQEGEWEGEKRREEGGGERGRGWWQQHAHHLFSLS